LIKYSSSTETEVVTKHALTATNMQHKNTVCGGRFRGCWLVPKNREREVAVTVTVTVTVTGYLF
jgi:hypothetical protein